jgi:hypothetical protein
VAVGCVGVVGSGDSALLQICGLGGHERRVFRRHVNEAIGCGGTIASRIAHGASAECAIRDSLLRRDFGR